VTFLVAGPAAIPLVWTHPRYSKSVKITVCLAMIVITAALVFGAGALMKKMLDYYQELSAAPAG
jgi:hypothetical protein